MAETIRQSDARPLLEPIWSEMSYIARNGTQSDSTGQKSTTTAAVTHCVPSLTTPDSLVHIGFGYTDVTGFGSFDTESTVLAFQAVIIGYDTDRRTHAVLPDVEMEAWGRAVLRPEWVEYAYRIHVNTGQDRRWFVYPVLIDRAKGPVNAPPDLDWGKFALRYPKRDPIIVSKLEA